MTPFKPHLETAFAYWEKWLSPHDTVIDATCGNGKDTQKLATLVPQGKVISLDIQEEALQKAKALVTDSHVFFYHQSHETFPVVPDPVKLVVYNLGYLPGGDKAVTTQTATTLISIQKALQLISWGGAVSILCYPGHSEGAREAAAVEAYILTLSPALWRVTVHRWREGSPFLIWVIKKP